MRCIFAILILVCLVQMSYIMFMFSRGIEQDIHHHSCSYMTSLVQRTHSGKLNKKARKWFPFRDKQLVYATRYIFLSSKKLSSETIIFFIITPLRKFILPTEFRAMLCVFIVTYVSRNLELLIFVLPL